MKIKAQIDRFIGKDNRVKAYASVILGGEYVIRDIAVMDSKNGLFARMPYRSYKDRNGNMQYSDVAFALNETSRNAVSDAVLEAYEQRLHMEEDESQDFEEQGADSNGTEFEQVEGVNTDQKLIKTVNMSAETTEFDTLVADVQIGRASCRERVSSPV